MVNHTSGLSCLAACCRQLRPSFLFSSVFFRNNFFQIFKPFAPNSSLRTQNFIWRIRLQLQLAVDAVDPFVVSWVPLDVAKMQKTQREPPSFADRSADRRFLCSQRPALAHSGNAYIRFKRRFSSSMAFIWLIRDESMPPLVA